MKYFILIFLATSVHCGFDYEFHQYLDRSHKRQNLISSSYSAEMAVGMLSLGAGGETQEELLKALDLLDQEDVAERFEDLVAMGHDTIEVNNFLVVQTGYTVKPTYTEPVEEHFDGTIINIDMSNSKEVDANINKWVNDRTHGRVQKLISKIGSGVGAILINTIYFKSKWANKFPEDFTEQEEFEVSATKSVPVQMMEIQDDFRAEVLFDLDAKVIELPFKKDGLVMLIYLPNKVDGLVELEKRIKDIKRPKDTHFVHLKLPKFRISTEIKLKPVLNLLGIRKAFVPSANLSGIVENANFFVRDIIQEAFIEINEDGAEAASVSGGRSPGLEFAVNVPFAYVIRDNTEVYFEGHVIEPEWY